MFPCCAAVLLGPLQCLTFLLNQGLLAAALGAFWAEQAPWIISVPVAALVRVAGTLAYICLSSWTVNENLFALLMSNVYALLVRPKSPLCNHCLSVDWSVNRKAACLQALLSRSHTALLHRCFCMGTIRCLA